MIYVAAAVVLILVFLLTHVAQLHVRVYLVSGRALRFYARILWKRWVYYVSVHDMRIEFLTNELELVRRYTLSEFVRAVAQNKVFEWFRKDGHRKLPGYILKNVGLTVNSFYMELGAGDAAATALLCGALLNTLTVSMRVFNGRVDVKDAGEIKLTPVWDKKRATLHLDCIISVKLRNIIMGYLKYLLDRRKTYAPDRKHNADDDERT